MNCPVCEQVTLTMAERQGIEIDYCPQCRGVWLDRGELDKIIEKASDSMTPSGTKDVNTMIISAMTIGSTTTNSAIINTIRKSQFGMKYSISRRNDDGLRGLGQRKSEGGKSLKSRFHCNSGGSDES